MRILNVIDYNAISLIRLGELVEKAGYTVTKLSISYKTKVIEAIFLGLPHLPIYINKYLGVLIGSELIQSYSEFINNEFALSDGLIKEFNNKYYKDLEPYYQRQFKNESLHIVMIYKIEEEVINLIKGMFKETYNKDV